MVGKAMATIPMPSLQRSLRHQGNEYMKGELTALSTEVVCREGHREKDSLVFHPRRHQERAPTGKLRFL